MGVGPALLAVPLTSLVGRVGNRQDLVESVAAPSVMTLTRMGGIGKTRLAPQAAVAADRFLDGVCVVELRRRHAEYSLNFAQAERRRQSTAYAAGAAAASGDEGDNLRAASESFAERADHHRALWLVIAAWWYAFTSRRYGLRAWAQTAVARPGGGPIRGGRRPLVPLPFWRGRRGPRRRGRPRSGGRRRGAGRWSS
jgi:hypothetical protein